MSKTALAFVSDTKQVPVFKQKHVASQLRNNKATRSWLEERGCRGRPAICDRLRLWKVVLQLLFTLIILITLYFPLLSSRYVGRKRLQVKNSERWVQGTKNLVHPDYSYWTLGYALSLQGAKKLLEAKPLSKMLPVDEFLPIMFNKHPKYVL